MENITLGQVAIALAFIVSFFTALAKFIAPVQTFARRVDKIEEHQENDLKRLDRLEDDTKQILLSVNCLLSHSIDNNHDDQLKQRKKEMDEYLIKR